MKSGDVTAVILTLNEEMHLPACLASVAWADAVLILDSGSTDGTLSVARSAGATAVVHQFVNYSLQRQRALELVRTPWTLFVDADERVPGALTAEIRAAIASTDLAGYWIPRANVFWGRTLRGGGWWPDLQLRLLRTDRAHFDPGRAVHELPTIDGQIGHLTGPLLHLNYATRAEFRAKQEAYAALDAQGRYTAGDRVRLRSYLSLPVRVIWRRFVLLGGWRDGVTGAWLALHMGAYELLTLVALRRLRQQSGWGPPARR